MAGLISVIVPNRDGEAILPACISALQDQSLCAYEVIVVDDSSCDGSVEMIKKLYPDVRVVALDHVHGFAGACCRGLEAAGGEWIAVLNSDARPRRGWLSESVSAAGNNPSIGMVASAVYLEDGTIDSMGIGVDRFGMAYLHGHRQKDPDRNNPAADFEQVFGPAGSAALYRRAMLEETGFYESDYFAYYEDLDIAFRARWKGYKCVLARNARVEHVHSYTVKRTGVDKRLLLQRNRLRTVARNWPGSWIVRYFPWLIAGSFAGVAAAMAEKNFRAPFKARKQFIQHLHADLKTRRTVLGNRNVDIGTMEHWLFHRSLSRKQLS